MLKSRKATFKPKVQPVRRPGVTPASTQSSARPSVESQSTTPAPETNTQNTHTSLSQPVVILPPVKAIPQSESSQAATEKEIPITNEPTRHRSTSPSKRKAQQEVIDQPPVKRVAILEHEASSQSQSRLHNTKPKSPEDPTTRSSKTIKQLSPSTTSITSGSPVGESINAERLSIATKTQSLRTQPDGASQPAPIITPVATDGGSSLTDEDESDHGGSELASQHQMRYPTPPQPHNVSTSSIPTEAAGADVLGCGATGDTDAIMEPGQTDEESRITRVAGLDPVGTTLSMDESVTSGNDTETIKKKKKTTKRKIQARKEGDDGRATVGVNLNRPRRAANPNRMQRKKDGTKKRTKRAVTPENAEEEVIDVTTIKMADLCKDMKIGKRFSKAALIKERQTKQKAANRTAKSRNEDDGTVAGDEAEQVGQGRAVSPPEHGNLGLQMRVVDGHIVLDDETTQVNRQDRHDAARVQEVVEEDDFTRVITSSTFNKKTWGKPRTQAWDEAATEMFYRGLRTWGTDFETIAKMFPHRNRKQIKMKFNKEERENGARVTRVMNEPRGPVNLEESLAEFQTLSGRTLEEVVDIEAEYEKVQAEHDAEQARRAKEKVDADAKKKAEIEAKTNMAHSLLDSAGEDLPESAKENAGVRRGKKKNGPKKKKNIHNSNGGETMEVLASIEID
jgi:transcription factor TFIIIB component B''